MKILIITTVPPQYTCGVNLHISYLLQGLREAKIQNDFLTYASQAQYTRMAFGKNLLRKLKIDALDTWLRRQKILHFRRLLKEQLTKEAYHLIHSHDCYATCAVLDEIGTKIPIITTLHGLVSNEMKSDGEKENSLFVRETISMEMRAFQGSSLCIAVDSKLADMLTNNFNVSNDKVYTIYNAVNISHIQTLAKNVNIFDVSRPFFLVPRRLVLKNGIEYAIKALQYCNQNISLAIAGEGPLGDELFKLASKLGLRRRVTFLGNVPQDQLLPLMMSSSGVIVPSIPSHGVVEATSLAVLEAIACRKPVIASNIGGISEILQPVNYPFLTKPGDIQQIGYYMDEVVAVDQLKLNQIIETNYNHLVSKHSLDVWIQSTLQAYQAACGYNFLGGKK